MVIILLAVNYAGMTMGCEAKNNTTALSKQKVGNIEAVGTVMSILGPNHDGSGTLIKDNLVLTAGHIVCVEEPGNNTSVLHCLTRTKFTLHDVFPVDNPNTAEDESTTRKNIDINGSVCVFPDYANHNQCGDLAIIKLDKPSSELVKNVTPIDVENPQKYTPKDNDNLTAVGFGDKGDCCEKGSFERKTVNIPIKSAHSDGYLDSTGKMLVCGGDSGGPLIDAYGHVAGVISSACNPGNTTSSCSCYMTFCSMLKAYDWILNGTLGQNGTANSDVNNDYTK